MYSKILLPMAHYLVPRADTLLHFAFCGCHVQNKVIKFMLAYTVFDGISLSGKELDIVSLSMLSFTAENGVVK